MTSESLGSNHVYQAWQLATHLSTHKLLERHFRYNPHRKYMFSFKGTIPYQHIKTSLPGSLIIGTDNHTTDSRKKGWVRLCFFPSFFPCEAFPTGPDCSGGLCVQFR